MNHFPRRRHHRGFVLAGYLASFLALLLLMAAGNFVLLLIFGERPFGSAASHRGGVLLCLLPLLFFFVAGALGRLGFRRFGRPFAQIMAATEAVAQGDLTVRMDENGPEPVQAMARSFNHMTSELARAEQQRRNLTADIAHELRNPLHIIQGNLEGMLDGVYEPNSETIGATLEETRLLARLVSDLQTLSLAEAGQLPLHPTRFAVADLLADVAASFAPRSAEQQITITVSADAADLVLLADYDRLDQVLSNLVSNALRYTPAGGAVRLQAAAHGDEVRISVSDTGSGIPADELPYVFDRFWKGDRARTREGVGSGLGLAIARQLVRAHSGSIEAASPPGSGAVFTVQLPRGSEGVAG
ncbi:MAG: HAMP domain-containing sensor histidine kinase [Caldilineales bacterium]|mgnify:CR=1 FL=1